METIHYAICFIARRVGVTFEFLLAKRATHKYMGGTWQLISGGIEPGETAWQAAIREVEEETSLNVLEMYRLTPVNTFYRSDIDKICVGIPFCLMTSESSSIRMNDENTEYRWFSIVDLPQQLMWESDRQTFAYLCSEILDNGPAKPYLRIEI